MSTTLADALVSSASRNLALRKRTDLVIKEQRHQGRVFYVVKDPVGLGYFRLREEEYFVLQLLDGTTSLDVVKEKFEKEFAPQQLTLKQLQWFIGQLHRNGLIVSDVGGQGEQLLRRREDKTRREWWGRLTNVMSMRFKGIDPENILIWLDRRLGWIYTPWFVTLCIIYWLAALALVLVQFDTFTSKLPNFHEFFQAKNAVWLIVALGVTKIIHEFGHGLTCKHFGGECHEMGVMFLVFTPCLYCNVSDSWMLPNKWHRIYISIGGIFIELCIASTAVFVWWFSQPGFLNYLALSTVFVCSVSTIMFNGNPLLRYDGYYVVADLLEIPNLWQKSRSVLMRALGTHCLGLKYPPDPFLPEKNHFVFGAYAVASSIYRWVVMFSILWFLHKVFEPYRLQVVGQVMAMASIFGLIVAPIYQIITFFWVPGRVSQVKPVRFVVSVTIAVATIALIAFFPLPRRVFAPFLIEPAGARSVYVTMPGELTEAYVKVGDVVPAGKVLATLTNVEVDLDLEDIKGQTAQQRVMVQTMIRRRSDPQINAQLPQAEVSLRDLEMRLAKREEERTRLILTAPTAGTVLPGDRAKSRPARGLELGEWEGGPLDECNRGAYFKKGVVFCRLGDPKKLEASIVVDQSDVEFINEGQEVALMLDELPGEPIIGKIAEISDDPLEYAPEALSEKAGGQLQTQPDPNSGHQRPLNTSYRVRVPIEKYDSRISLNSRGEAKIYCGTTTLWSIAYRYFSATFNFK